MPINVIKDNTITNTGVPAVINNVWSNLLPSGYTQLEYIESSGTQWINTGITAENYPIDINIDFVYTEATAYGNIVTAQGGGSQTRILRLNNTGANFQWFSGGRDHNLGSVTVGSNYHADIHYESGASYITLNGTKTTDSSTLAGFTQSFYLFAGGYAGGSYFGSAKIYNCKFTVNGIVVRNFIPAKNSSNVIGMYDTVTNTFFTNAGTGDFIAGPAQPSYTIKGNTVQTNNLLPVEYKAIDFIESHGTEYIDTGYAKPNTKCRAKTRVSFNDTTSRFLIGPSGQPPNYFGRHINNKFELNNVHTTMTTTVGTIYDLDYVCNGTTSALTASDGTTTETLTANQAGSIYNNNWFVYGVNTGSSASFILKGKIYKFELYDNGTLVRDMIPAKRLTDNVLGMYDKVEGKFYTNKGTGSFSGAEEMSENLTNYILNATVTGDGTQAIQIPSPALNVNWKENTRYTFSLDCSASNITYSSDGNLIFFTIKYTDGSLTYTGVQSSNYQQGRISFTTQANKTVESIMNITKHARWTGGTITISNLQIEEGTTATSYTPYGQIPADTDNTCDIPSPTHPVELHSVGDKITDSSDPNYGKYAVPIFHQGGCGVVDMGTLNYQYNASLSSMVLNNFGIHTTLDRDIIPAYCEKFKSISYDNRVSIQGARMYTAEGNVYFRDSGYADSTTFKQAMSGVKLYYQSTTDTEWTTGVQTIYPANPLRRVGNVCDYIDYENQRIVRNVGVRICTGTETWNYDSTYGRFSTIISGALVGTTRTIQAYCSHYICLYNREAITDVQNGNFYVGTQNYLFHDSLTSLAEWTAWLAQQYANGTPVTILYPLATPTYEAITLPVLPVETQDKLNLYNVQTKLAPSEISVTYRGNLVEGHNITYNNKYYPIKYNNTDY